MGKPLDGYASEAGPGEAGLAQALRVHIASAGVSDRTQSALYAVKHRITHG